MPKKTSTTEKAVKKETRPPKEPKAKEVKAKEVKEVKETAKKGQYIYSVGRRKSANARVKLYQNGTGQMTVNSRSLETYLPGEALRHKAIAPLEVMGMEKKVDLEIIAAGGGINGQADAIRLGLARALVKIDEASKTTLKKAGLMTRDSREKERKKPGLKRARRAPQWQKR